jgi:hypothetical protein
MSEYEEPDNAYHYTSPQGAFSILQTKTLWFTDSQYLNDKSENKYTTDERRRYILCASCNSDTVAMWNYYVKNNTYQGYNLGIDVNKLKELLQDDIGDDIKLESKKVKYDGKKCIFSKHSVFKSEEEYRFVLTVSPKFSFDKNGHTTKMKQKSRMGNNGIITPYLEWQYPPDLKSQLFTRITLAPMIEKDLAKASVERFLLEDVYKKVKIVPSSLEVRF